MTTAISALSKSIAGIVAAAAPLVCAIGVGPSRHLTGLVCGGDTIVTINQALPVQDSYLIVLANRLPMSARPGPRNANLGLALLQLDTPWPALHPEIASCAVGNLAIVIGADADASPTARLTLIHRLSRTADGPVPVLDLQASPEDQGSAVLDLDGRLLGLLTRAPSGEAIAIPAALLGRMLSPTFSNAAPSIAPSPPNRRGWLGVALQPITVPEQLVSRAGQPSGRMVVSITKGGPADLAGLRVGDVLLALDETSASGPNALRAFLGGDRVGTTVEAKLLRDGVIVAARLTITQQPA